MKNKSGEPLSGSEHIIDRIADAADTIANSPAYRHSHKIAVFLLGVAVVLGINKGLDDQHDSAPNKPQQAVTIVEDE